MSFNSITRWRYCSLHILIAAAFYSSVTPHVFAKDIIFNMDVLDIEDKENINLEQFSRAGHIMPGTYTLEVKVNQYSIGEYSVAFIEDKES
ncbi:hypothetical protein JZL89_20830, partial [Providencia rettgeri]|uniref:FimD/PapC N-terminal domain-containing protein n=1 Tax=Providencia rettgeri TaxID=587 RepID=UPI0019D2DB4A